MTLERDAVDARIRRLELQVRALRVLVASVAVLAILLAAVPRPQAQQVTDSLRVRQLIVEDTDGRARVVLGYLDAPGNRSRIGMRINDPRGVERLGLSYRENGSMVMGFDAPPGTGDDRNRERINIVADEKGGAHIRFLDRRTSVASRLYTPSLIRRYGLGGDEVIQTKP
jgi:hypothetical protein